MTSAIVVLREGVSRGVGSHDASTLPKYDQIVSRDDLT